MLFFDKQYSESIRFVVLCFLIVVYSVKISDNAAICF